MTSLFLFFACLVHTVVIPKLIILKKKNAARLDVEMKIGGAREERVNDLRSFDQIESHAPSFRTNLSCRLLPRT